MWRLVRVPRRLFRYRCLRLLLQTVRCLWHWLGWCGYCQGVSLHVRRQDLNT